MISIVVPPAAVTRPGSGVLKLSSTDSSSSSTVSSVADTSNVR